MITIFTPTYNREHTLKKLYESLKNQTDKDFEWLIVDDGSKDNTKKLIENFQKENILEIRYFYKENGGKQRAINFALEKARGKYFFIVDSDDFLSSDAVSIIKKYDISLPKNFGGLVFRKIPLKDTSKIDFTEKYIDSNPLDIVFKYKILGDKGEIFKTEILKKFPFPEIENEKFVPEGYIWNKIGLSYDFRYIDYGIYYFEYLDDGYTRNFKKDLKRNPKGFNMYYKNMLTYDIPLKAKFKYFLRYLETKVYCIFK